jgi:uncharacterized protein YjbI with pentapeptide repeats
MDTIPQEILDKILENDDRLETRLINRSFSSHKNTISKQKDLKEIYNKNAGNKFYFENIEVNWVSESNYNLYIENLAIAKIKTLTFNCCFFEELDLSRFRNLKKLIFNECMMRKIKIKGTENITLEINKSMLDENFMKLKFEFAKHTTDLIPKYGFDKITINENTDILSIVKNIKGKFEGYDFSGMNLVKTFQTEENVFKINILFIPKNILIFYTKKYSFDSRDGIFDKQIPEVQDFLRLHVNNNVIVQTF